MIKKVALIGLGNVHKNLLKIINDKRNIIADQHDICFQIIMIADSSGIAIDENGFDAASIRAAKLAGKSVKDFMGFKPHMNVLDAIKQLDLDLLFEGSPVNLKNGEPALSTVKTALKSGISVVLANKGPIVMDFAHLHQLAEDNKAGLKYSATVCGGLPVLNIAERDMIGAEITSIRGVFNGTSNFMLDALLNGSSYDDALKEAQNIGAAEADPSLDVEGWDTAFKLVIIANSMLGANITLKDIDVTGITDITKEELEREAAIGNTIKLVANIENGKYSVKPTILDNNDFLAQCNGWEMAVEIHTDIYGVNYHKLLEREPVPTAASMLRDAVNIFNSPQ